MSSSAPLSCLILLLSIATLHRLIDAHGCMVDPRFRGTLYSNSISVPKCVSDLPSDDCPHCLNGGGKGAVALMAKGNWRPYEPLDPKKPFRHDAGLCGDAIADSEPRDHEKGGRFGPPKSMPYSAVYKAGQVVEFVSDVTTNHNGFFEFFVCDVSKCGGDVTEKCFTGGHCKQMYRVKTDACESQQSKECAPIDPKYPGRWYIPCRKGGHVGEHFMGGKYMRYQLPKGFQCEDCVLQWYWNTANSCNPPGFKEYFEAYPMPGWGSCPGDGGALGGRNPTLSQCGGKEFPEEFWSCADVRITGSRVPPPAKMPQCGARTQLTGSNDDDDNDDDDEQEMAQTKVVEQKPVEMKKAVSNDGMQASKPVSGAQVASDCVLNISNDDVDPNAKCAGTWKQCGGKGFQGPTDCCSPEFSCVQVNEYYAQCQTASGKQAERR